MELIKTMATGPTPAGIERRAHARTAAQFEVRYGKDEDVHDATACDISPAGIGLVGPKQYPVGTEVELRFRAAEGAKSDLLTMKARVRHSTPQRLGLEFVNVPPSDTMRILDLIKRLVGKQAAK